MLYLTPSQATDALDFLRALSAPGMRYINGQLVYSAAFLSEPYEGQEVLPI